MFIIDFDDTLLDTQRYKQTINVALASCGVSADEADWSYKAAYHTPDGQFAHSHKRRAEFLAMRGHDQSKILSALEKVSDHETLQNHVLPGAIEFLKAVRAIGQPMILLSLGDPEFQELKVRGAGVAEYFDRLFMVSESKEKIVSELIVHHSPTEYWLVNDKVSESKKLAEKFPDMRVVLRRSPKINLADYEASEYQHFATLAEIQNYILEKYGK